MQRLRADAAGVNMIDPFAGHGRHCEFLAALGGIEPVVALGVVEGERAFGAGDFDPGRTVVRIARREIPAAANHHHDAVIHCDRGEHDVMGAIYRLHVTVSALAINADRLRRLEQPEHEIEIVRQFHHHRRQPDPAGDFLAEIAREMPAHQHGNDIAERAVGNLLFGKSDFRIEALRIADGEFQIIAL